MLYMKKKRLKGISVILVCCILATSIFSYSSNVKANSFDEVTASTTPPECMSVHGSSTSLTFQTQDKKVRVCHPQGSYTGYRTQINEKYYPGERDITFAMEQIDMGTQNYSVAIALGNGKGQWYSQAGYMLVYCKDGSFAIGKTETDENGMGAVKFVKNGYQTHELEPFTDTVSIQISLAEDKDSYSIIINGQPITLLKGEKWQMDNPEKLTLGFGILPGFEITGDTNIQFLNSAYIALENDVSYVLDMDYCSPKLHSARNLRPLAKYVAFMDHVENFKENLTRRDAIVAMAKLLVAPEDIQGVYTTDFEDVTSGDAGYDAIAYMDRSGYLPESGSKLEPNRAITKSEFLDLMLSDEDIWDGEDSDLVSQDTITGEEAAKYLCEYLGKDDEGSGYVDLATTDTTHQIIISADTVAELRQAITDATQYSENTRAIITLAEGEYCFTESLVIDHSTCGEIVIRGAENAQSIVTGNQDIRATKFQAVTGQDYWVHEFEKQGENYPQFRDVYLNGERLQLAKSVESTFTKENQDESGNLINQFYYDTSVYDSSELQELPEICMNVGWRNKRFHVATFDADNGYLSVDEEEWNNCVNTDKNKWTLQNEPYWFENSLAFLDEPGEFFYDAENGKLYIYPYSSVDMTKNENMISYPTVEKLFELQGVSGITFEGITFTGVTSNYVTENGINTGQNNTDLSGDGHIQAAAVYGLNTAHIKICNCTFNELGANGIYLNEGNHNIVMKGNSFTDIAMSAVVLGKQSGPWSYTYGLSNIVFDNNYVFDIGTDYLSAPAVCISYVKNIAVTHNTILHTPYTGISVGWIVQPGAGVSVRNAEVSYNRLEDNLYALNDGSALYFAGANGETQDTEIYNYVHDNSIKGTGYTKTYSGIYLDMNASNYGIYRNVIDGIVTSSLHGPIYCQYINNSYEATTQQTYNIIIQENYTTMKPITVSSVLKDNNIQLTDNKNYAAASVLSYKAQQIVANAGQEADYQLYRPDNDTEIVMMVPEPHIIIKHGEEASEAHVEFQITNHGDSNATYSIAEKAIGKNAVLSNELTLAPGATGAIECRFVCKDSLTNDESYSLAKYEKLANLTIVREDGWKQEYKRVVGIKVGLPIYRSQYNSAVTYDSMENGVKICMSSDNTYQAASSDYVTVRNSYYMRNAGIDIQVTDISSTDDNYSIGIMLSNATTGASESGDLFNGWFNQSGYMFVFGKCGQFTIIETDDDENTTLDGSAVIVSEQLEQLDGALSMHIRLDGDNYRVAVGEKCYVIPAKDKQYPLTDIENLFVAFGVLGDRTNDADTYVKEIASGNSISFVVSQLGLSRRDEIIIGGGDTNEVSLYLESGDLLPTGYYYEYKESQDGKYIVNWTDQEGNIVTRYASGQQDNYVANTIDLDMLHLYYQKNLYIDNVYRFIASVDDEAEYEEKGFIFSLDDSCKEPTKEDIETNNKVHFKSVEGYYTGIQAQVKNGEGIETFKVGRDMYDLNSKLLFVRAYKLPSADEKNPIYIRAWVKLKDSDTIVYGPVATFERESDYYNPDIKDDDFTVIN